MKAAPCYTVPAASLATALAEAGRVDLAARVLGETLSRAEASDLSVDFCQRGHGRLATLLARFAHPLPLAA